MISVTVGTKAVHLTGSVYMPTLCGKSPSAHELVATDAETTCKRCIKSAERDETNRKW